MLTHYERGEMSISLGVEIFIWISGKYHTKNLISSKKKTKKQTFDLFFNATINGDVKNRHVKFIEI